MACLIDTHVFLWMARHPERLSERVRELVLRPERELLWLSSASLHELAIKIASGKLIVPYPLSDIARALDVSIDAFDGQAAHQYIAARDVPHRDPFDRAIAAHARKLAVPLISADPAFALFPGLQVIW
jgi:PIN domain nuclease of toxin-antitoxin system